MFSAYRAKFWWVCSPHCHNTIFYGDHYWSWLSCSRYAYRECYLVLCMPSLACHAGVVVAFQILPFTESRPYSLIQWLLDRLATFVNARNSLTPSLDQLVENVLNLAAVFSESNLIETYIPSITDSPASIHWPPCIAVYFSDPPKDGAPNLCWLVFVWPDWFLVLTYW